MDAIKQKILDVVNEMRNSFSTQKNNENYTDLADYVQYATIVKQDGEEKMVWTKALQKALNESKYVFIPKGRYYIDRSIIMHSNTKIRASEDAEICLLKGTKTLLLRNDGVRDGSYHALPVDESCAENISIEGGVWSEENGERLGYGASGCFDQEHSLVGVSTCLLFSGVKNLCLRNMRFKHTAGFAVQIGRCENFVIENIYFDDCFADGVHINGFVKNGYIGNITGKTGDDLIALNMYDWEDSTINNGPLDTVLVENLHAISKHGHNSLRIQPGRLSLEDGEIDCFVRNLYVREVKGVCVFKMYLQTPAYKEKPDGAKVGWGKNIVFENIEISLEEPVDKQPNYLNGNPITGHFAAFEIGSNIEGLYFENISVRLNKDKYPYSHFITVGPKSQYIPEKGIELFDPYIVCCVKNIYYKNVQINGKEISDLAPYIKEVQFNRLYDSEYATGYGKLENIIKL